MALIGMVMLGYVVLYAGSSWLADIRKWRRLWKNCKLVKDDMYPLIRGKEKRSYGYMLKVSLPYGLSSDDFLNRQLAIEQFLNRRVRISYKSKHVIIEVFEKPLVTKPFNVVETKGEAEVLIGLGYTGYVTVDLDQEPHLLIAGETGSGKSNALRSIITNLVLTKPDVGLHLIDLKRGAEFGLFKDCRNVLSFSSTVSEAEEVLLNVSAEVTRRYKLFAESGCVDIKEYPLPRQFVFIDEFSLLAKQRDKKCVSSMALIEDLAAIARACGIHLVISTQRPDSVVVSGRIKANFPVVLGLKTANRMNSRIIIDENGLERLSGQGHGRLKYQGQIQEVQTMHLQPIIARRLLDPFNVETIPTVHEAKVVSFDVIKQRK